MTSEAEIQIIRSLAARVSEIAQLPVQEEKRSLWRQLNSLQRPRPLVIVDQVCWGEMNVDDELTCQTTDPALRGIEGELRHRIYKWTHFPVDHVVEPYWGVSHRVTGAGMGVETHAEYAESHSGSVVGQRYENQFQTEADVEKIQMPHLVYDKAETMQRFNQVNDLFGDILDVRLNGATCIVEHQGIWDHISFLMSVEGALYAMIDTPELVHKVLAKMVAFYRSSLEQCEALGVLPRAQHTIHCTGAYTDELPADGYDPDRPRVKDLWCFTMAQMFSSVSPAMMDEFEVPYVSQLAELFGMVYYGCCEPLHNKMDQVRKIPNVRKISMSPWADPQRGAEEIGGDYVFSCKPNPAHLAMESFDEGLVRRELENVKSLCEANGCPLEFILKDISTVRQQPERLWKWAQIAMDVAEQ